MALVTISGEPASGWEEAAYGVAQRLGFELVTETRLAQRIVEEFGGAAIPERAWRPAAVSILARLAAEHHLVIALDGAEHLFESEQWGARPDAAGEGSLLRVRITAPEGQRAGQVMLDQKMQGQKMAAEESKDSHPGV